MLTGLIREDGSFSATLEDGEYDMRFVYCAGAISEFLNDWSGFDVDKAVQFVVGSQVILAGSVNHSCSLALALRSNCLVLTFS